MHPIMKTHAGLILAEREHNGYNDSDWVIDWWDVEEVRAVFNWEYASTRGPFNEHNNPNGIDPNPMPAVQEAFKCWRERIDRNGFVRGAVAAIERGEVFKGDFVEVYKGRKVAKGTRGRVMTLEEKVDHVSRYGTWETKNTYALLDTGNGYVKVNVEHCRVIKRGCIVQKLFDMAG